jgi:hypothetical protein
MPKVVANGKTFNFPEGTTNNQIGEAIDEYFASIASAPAENDLGDAPDVFNQFPEPEQAPDQESSFADNAIGAGEAALTLATGATGGLLGTVGGFAEGVFDEVNSGQFGTPEAANRIADSAGQFNLRATDRGRSRNSTIYWRTGRAFSAIGRSCWPTNSSCSSIKACTATSSRCCKSCRRSGR